MAIAKVSEITPQDAADRLRVDLTTETEEELQTLIDIATKYISDYTGLPITSEDGSKTVDDVETFVIAVFVLVQDMYDNGTYYVDKGQPNKTVESILNMHAVNLM